MIKNYKKWLSKPTSKSVTGTQCSEEIQLIEGTFSPIEAADVLLSLVTYKIKFHNLQLLGMDEKNGVSKEQSERRIAELKEAKSRITEIIMEARNRGTSIEIKSNINITLVPPK
ncbi:MAG: hypothetical protein AAGH81_19015 [Bacteroidota bacterium]